MKHREKYGFWYMGTCICHLCQYRITQESRGSLKVTTLKYGIDPNTWEHRLRFSRSPLFVVDKMQVICCLCLVFNYQTNSATCWWFQTLFGFFLISVWIYVLVFQSSGSEKRQKTKVLLGSVRSAYIINQTLLTFFFEWEWISTHSLWKGHGICMVNVTFLHTLSD